MEQNNNDGNSNTPKAPPEIYTAPSEEAESATTVYTSSEERFDPTIFNENTGESNLVIFAREELFRSGMITRVPKGAEDKYNNYMAESVLAVMRTLASQGHSGGSISDIKTIVDRLIEFKPLTPLTGENDEWIDISEMAGRSLYQNKRSPIIFKDGDKSYNIEGRTFEYPDGTRVTSAASRLEIKFPYRVPSKPEIVKVDPQGVPFN